MDELFASIMAILTLFAISMLFTGLVVGVIVLVLRLLGVPI